MRAWLFVLAVALPTFAPVQSHCKDTGLIFVSNEKSNNLIVLDPKTYQVVKDIKVSRRPRDMHFNSDHSKLYIACGDDDVIDIVDVATVALAYSAKVGDPRYDPRLDLNGDGKIDISDVAAVAFYFGTSGW